MFKKEKVDSRVAQEDGEAEEEECRVQKLRDERGLGGDGEEWRDAGAWGAGVGVSVSVSCG